MSKQQRINKRIQNFSILAVICVMLSMPILATASAATVATLMVVPTSNANVISVVGNGFDPNEPVYLALVNATTGVVVYNFTESIATTPQGMFSKEVTLPPATYGTYNVYAKTSSQVASREYTIAISTTPKITVSPANSNIIKVVGSGFGSKQIVFFTMLGTAYSSYNFTDYAVTDTLGNFTLTLIIPTSISGNYTLIAGTQTGATANAAITVPDLTGPKGDTGATGDRGPKGAAGPAGKDADNTILYAALIVSIIAAVISIASLLRDREPDDD
ncbi:MAG: collagen-like protein [Candidatus Bathyarchaeota archaeon]|nr:collagen-like protein [Candidatus Bathyarchaeota archaeon]